MSNVIYQEKLSCQRLRKIRGEDQDENKGDLNYTSEKDLDEEILDFSFMLGTVLSWEPYTNPFNSYTGNYPPTTQVETVSHDLLILISYKEFDRIMTEFINKQNRYAGNTEELST